MPARDRTGPGGHGPTTGRGMGDCGGEASEGVGARGWGRGWGQRLGRRWAGAGSNTPPAEDDVEGLRAESSRLKEELNAVERRLSSLEQQD